MKFDCGETPKERQFRLSNWHPFFCIFPRNVGPHDCRWLEWIERRGTLSWSSMDGEWLEWEYRPREKNSD
jgi:hypothetical protein